MTVRKQKRPEQRLDMVLRAPHGDDASKDIAKTFTTMKVVKAAEDEVDDEIAPNLFRPTDEQVALINQYTVNPKTADDLAVFPTLACNTLWDRDDDRFTEDTVKQFTTLPAPFSPLGKSFMVGHNYTMLPKGRLFDQGMESSDGTDFLKLWAYMPNTDQNKEFLENVDFGVYWAVSVGVQLESAACSACKEPWSWNPWFCINGHEKGYTYDLDSDDEDDWGYPLPVELGGGDASKAVFCGREFIGAKDFYELSMVYLGAQYFAELADKDPSVAGLIKAASADHPIVNLSREEAKGIPLPHEDERVVDARKKFKVVEDEDGTVKWTDDQSLVWVFDGEEVLSLGKAAPEPVETPEPTKETTTIEAEAITAESIKAGVIGAPVAPAPKEESTVSKKAVQAALATLKFPQAVLDQVEAADDDTALTVALTAAHTALNEEKTRADGLAEKAALGDEYVKGLRTEVIDMYRKAHLDPTTPDAPVNVDTATKLVEACGDNVKLLSALLDDYTSQAQSKFPDAVRRSSFPADPHALPTDSDKEVDADQENQSVSRIHG